MRSKQRKWLVSLLAVLLLGTLLAGCTASSASSSISQATATPASLALNSEEAAEKSAAILNQDQKNIGYLLAFFGVKAEDVWTVENFGSALTAITGQEAAIAPDFSPLAAVEAAVIAANYDELAKTYPEEKVAERLALYGITGTPDRAAYLACALDTGLMDEKTGKSIAGGTELTSQQGVNLLMAVANATGKGRNYLGESNDPQISARLDNMWNSFVMFDDDSLTQIGKTAVEEGVTTGYNLKDGAFAARFLPEYTLQYGHDDIKHAHQLLGLLNSENITAKVQLEPKVSVYQYLLEWGPVPEPEPTYEVRQFGEELYLVFAVEYDMQLEFSAKEEMLAFDAAVKEYAKKNVGNEEAVGLIYSSWWQPLYTATREDMPVEDFHLIYDCVVQNGDYSIHPFCLPDHLENTVEALETIGAHTGAKVEAVERFCNTAFYNYLTGDDFQ